MTLDVMDQIYADLEKVEQADIDRVTHNLTPEQPGEEVLGTIHSLGAQKIWALGYKYAGQSVLAKYRAYYEAAATEEYVVEDLQKESDRLGKLSDFCRQIFWMQCRTDIGGSAWTAQGIGLRKNFILVARGVKKSMAGSLTMLPPGLGDVLRGLFHPEEGEEE